MTQTREIKVFKAKKRQKTPYEYERDNRIALLTLLIEMDFDRAKLIIERIAASKRQEAQA
jgi:hypothetical protein